MKKKTEIHSINDDLFLAVVRTQQQFKEMSERAFKGEDKDRFEKDRSELIAHGFPAGEMGIFFIGKNGTVLDSSALDYKEGKLSFGYSRTEDTGMTLGAFLTVPYREENIQVEPQEVPSERDVILNEVFSDLLGGLRRAILSSVFEDGQDEEQNSRSNYWNNQTVKEVVDLSLNLRNSLPNTSIFGVGNSPSYVVFAIEQLARHSVSEKSTGYVPFSDRFLARCYNHSPDVLTFHVNTASDEYVAAQRYQDDYRHFLTGMGLNPREIVNRFNQAGQKTTILDNIQSGGSFASFIYFMYQWAGDIQMKKAFSRAFQCIALVDRKTPEVISVPDVNLEVPIDCIEISHKLRCALNSNVSDEKDRFIPQYPPENWGKPLPPAEGDPALVKEIKQGICAEIGQSAKSVRPLIVAPYKGLSGAQPRTGA